MDVYWLARIIGPFFFIMGLWMYLRGDEIQKIWDSIKANPALFYIGGVLNLLIGLTMLSTYSSWSFGIPLLLTLLGYLITIRGIVSIFAPERVIEMTERLLPMQKSISLIPLVIGFLLSLYAFI